MRVTILLGMLLGSLLDVQLALGGVLFDTAAGDQTNSAGILGDSNWLMHRFELSTPTQLDTVGGLFSNRTSAAIDIFAAVVELTGPTDYPDTTDLSSGDVVGTSLIQVPVTGLNGVVLESGLPAVLQPGWHALVFGTNKFGASSVPFAIDELLMPYLEQDLAPGQVPIVAIQPGHPSLDVGFVDLGDPARFFARGVAVPEPGARGTWVGLAIGASLMLRMRRRRAP